MASLVAVGIGIVVVFLAVGTLVYAARAGWLEPDTNEDSPEEKADFASEVGSKDFRVPLRGRVRAWTLPMKVFVVGVVGIVLGVIFVAWDAMRTGSPAQQYLSTEVQMGVVAAVGIVGGIYLQRYFDSLQSEIAVIYERKEGRNLVELIPFAANRLQNRNGKTTVPELTQNRFIGLFPRFRQVGEDRRLRGEDKPLSDVIQHQLPDHAEERPDGDGFIVRTRKDGDEVLTSAASGADITYRSPETLSDARATEIREQRRRTEAEISQVRATNAELWSKVEKMRKKIENEEYRSREDFKTDFEDFAAALQSQIEAEANKESQEQQTVVEAAENGAATKASGRGR